VGQLYVTLLSSRSSLPRLETGQCNLAGSLGLDNITNSWELSESGGRGLLSRVAVALYTGGFNSAAAG
jgi:hypothetical protein